jgi:ferrous iron transport protein A
VKGEKCMCLSELGRNSEAIVKNLSGDQRFISRITSIGLTPGCNLRVIRNDKNRPMLVYSRDTMIALNRKECMGIEVAEVTA